MLDRVQALLASQHALQRVLPALLELCRDQPVVRIACHIAALSELGLVACLLQFELHDAPLISLDFHVPPFGLQRRFDRHGLDGAQELPSDRFIGAPPAKRKASRQRQL